LSCKDGDELDAVKQALFYGFLPILAFQCAMGLWMWKLSFNGRETLRGLARSKAKYASLLEAVSREQTDTAARDSTGSPSPSPRLGIALSGGGGKGAYQVGVLRVLRAAGLRPGVIAGTSAGALNATLLCLNEIEFATEFWSTVSLSGVARVGLANLAALPLLLFGLITAGGSDDIDSTMRRAILMPFYVTMLTINVFGIVALHWPVLGVAVDVAACVGMVTLGYHADTLVGRLGLALLSNAPLAATIQVKAPPDRVRAAGTPLFVTVAARRRVIDPNHPRWLQGRKDMLMARQPYVPEYRCLQEESDEDMQHVVLQSAAIPFGVFPLRRIGRSDYVDGGVADNVPIRPLIDAGCSSIIVVHLDPDAECDGWRLTDQDDLWAREGQLRELRRLALLNQEHTIEALAHEARVRAVSPALRNSDDDKHVRQDYKRDDVEIVHVVPSESLGGFFTGTMNFRATKARRLMELGERDARDVLARHPELAVWMSKPLAGVRHSPM
jgi:NTE family protein